MSFLILACCSCCVACGEKRSLSCTPGVSLWRWDGFGIAGDDNGAAIWGSFLRIDFGGGCVGRPHGTLRADGDGDGESVEETSSRLLTVEHRWIPGVGGLGSARVIHVGEAVWYGEGRIGLNRMGLSAEGGGGGMGGKSK